MLGPRWLDESVAAGDAEARKAIGRFWNHWLELPRAPGQIAPDLSKFLDFPDPALQPRVALLDVVPPDKLIVRLLSSAREADFGRYLTGSNALDVYPPADRARVWESAREVVARPCGWLTERVVIAASGKATRYLAINLPLSPKDGGAPVMANYSVAEKGIERGGEKSTVSFVAAGQWIDLGAGTPKA